uniref:C-type lectin domain-containing protein n=1 Tax=Nothobranchius furzeri TaxID=105023 RepID=A0A8C6KD25_NOTFU
KAGKMFHSSLLNDNFVCGGVGFPTGKAWIGLNDDLLNGWKWSLSDSSYYVEGNTTYRNWYPGYPSSYITQQECVRMYAYEYSGRWFDTSCISLFPFVCYNGLRSFKLFVFPT